MNRAERRRTTPSRAQAQAHNDRRRTILYATLGALAIILIVSVGYMSQVPKSASEAPPAATLQIGQVAPEFSVSTTSGPFDLAKSHDMPTMLEVFATWCPHCQHEARIISGLNRDYGSRVHIVGVEGSDRGMDNLTATQADMLAWAKKYDATYPIAFDADLTVAKAYLQGGYPTIVLIDKDQKVLAVGGGEVAEKSLRTGLNNLIAGKPVNTTIGP